MNLISKLNKFFIKFGLLIIPFLLFSFFISAKAEASLINECTGTVGATSTAGAFSNQFTSSYSLPYTINSIGVRVKTDGYAELRANIFQNNSADTILATSTKVAIGLQGSYSNYDWLYFNFGDVNIATSTLYFEVQVLTYGNGSSVEHEVFNNNQASCTHSSASQQFGATYLNVYNTLQTGNFNAIVDFILPNSNEHIYNNRVDLSYNITELSATSTYLLYFEAEVASSTSSRAPQYAVYSRWFMQENGAKLLVGGNVQSTVAYAKTDDYLLLDKGIYDISLVFCQADSNLNIIGQCIRKTHTNITVSGTQIINNSVAHYDYPIVCFGDNCTDSAGTFSSSTKDWACFGGYIFGADLGICFGSAISSITNFMIYPHDSVKSGFKESFEDLKQVFPFNVFFDFSNIFTSSTQATLQDFTLSVPYQNKNFNIYTSSTVEEFLGSENKEKLFNIEEASMWSLLGFYIIMTLIL